MPVPICADAPPPAFARCLLARFNIRVQPEQVTWIVLILKRYEPWKVCTVVVPGLLLPFLVEVRIEARH